MVIASEKQLAGFLIKLNEVFDRHHEQESSNVRVTRRSTGEDITSSVHKTA